MAGTGRRNRFRIGSHLVTDDLTGFTEYAENVFKDWRGLMIHKKYPEPRNPQEFIRVGTDPKAILNTRPPIVDVVYVSSIPSTVGTTSVTTGKNMIDHYYIKEAK